MAEHDAAMEHKLANGRGDSGVAYGRRLLPTVPDDHARRTPERLYASIPRSSDLSLGFQDITCVVMANAVSAFAHWIEGYVGRGERNETLAYMGPADLRTSVVVLGAVKVGCKVGI